MNELRVLAIEGLKVLKEDFEKDNTVAKYGIDLSNFSREPGQHLVKMISHIVGCHIDSIEWWLYELSDDRTVRYEKDGVEVSSALDTPEKFVAFYMD